MSSVLMFPGLFWGEGRGPLFSVKGRRAGGWQGWNSGWGVLDRGGKGNSGVQEDRECFGSYETILNQPLNTRVNLSERAPPMKNQMVSYKNKFGTSRL